MLVRHYIKLLFRFGIFSLKLLVFCPQRFPRYCTAHLGRPEMWKDGKTCCCHEARIANANTLMQTSQLAIPTATERK